MRTAHLLLLLQGALGAFDTLWYHEFRARLPRQASAIGELRLHAARDVIYAVLFGTLGWFAWHGALAWLLVVLLACEVAITLSDFAVEARIRTVPAGERSTHAIMGIVYGAFLACLLPDVWQWAQQPTGFVALQPTSHFRSILTIMGAGVLLSGVRDALAASRAHSPGREVSAESRHEA